MLNTLKVSQRNGNNIEEILAILDKKDAIKNTTMGTGGLTSKSCNEDWALYSIKEKELKICNQ